ncbi:glycoside hydrolase family 5 protein [Gonapodya prolifera JEL478]|uniref:Glycoside hydrolase family 5 protein n=1 Tax=Gonapodya prolifera (strain JEL478) TaxID=1344416 RepID=A0A139AH99_GONPJ|nr:glycoside hydrolase family 5 protein [Gonapodya prolifera JEL478]|eukprot:KXS16130.1 glycoside hydrolase family 5 protein [Gonapodya prolifera JEL478]
MEHGHTRPLSVSRLPDGEETTTGELVPLQSAVQSESESPPPVPPPKTPMRTVKALPQPVSPASPRMSISSRVGTGFSSEEDGYNTSDSESGGLLRGGAAPMSPQQYRPSFSGAGLKPPQSAAPASARAHAAHVPFDGNFSQMQSDLGGSTKQIPFYRRRRFLLGASLGLVAVVLIIGLAVGLRGRNTANTQANQIQESHTPTNSSDNSGSFTVNPFATVPTSPSSTASPMPLASPSLSPLTVQGSRIIEYDTGRSVHLHGVNIVSKYPPFTLVDVSSAAAISAALDPLVNLGYNFVRLGFTWEAYEPQRGIYTVSYLSDYVTLVRELGARGIYTLVDFHQDTFSRWSLGGCGEGFPQWAVPDAQQSTPANYTSADDLRAKGCALWGVTNNRQVSKGGDLDVSFGNLMVAGTARDSYAQMVGNVAKALIGLRNCVLGFDIINEPYLVNNAFYEAAYASIVATGWDYPNIVVEPAFKNNVLSRPNVPNVIYAPHYYDWRFIMDEVYIQLQYAIQNGGLTAAAAAFLANPSAATGAFLNAQLGFVLTATDKLTEWMGNGQTGAAVSTYLSGASAVQTSLTSFQLTATSLSANPDATSLSSFTTSITNVVDNLNGQLFSASTGLFPALAPQLTSAPLATDAAMTSMTTDSNALGTVPLILGEFGCDGAATFIDCPGWVWAMASSAEAQLASGWAQWAYVPIWTPQLGDLFNLESLSITTGVQGGYQPRATMMTGRPHVRKVAGNPTAIQVGKNPVSLSVTFNTVATVSNSTTELFFDDGAACGGLRASNVVATPAGATCSVARKPLLLCDSSGLPAGTAVTISVSC